MYVDGFNFYYGLKNKPWKKYYWLDTIKFFESMLRDNQELIEVHYFSARPIGDEQAYNNQDLFFSANKMNRKFKLTLGKYLKKKITCRKCQNIINTYEEKETDVRIATQMINDVYLERCDITIIVSADSDMVPAVELMRQISPQHKIFVYFPPTNHSFNLKSCCDYSLNLAYYERKFRLSLLPDEIALPNGYTLHRPENWR